MGQFHAVCRAADVPTGEGKTVVVGNKLEWDSAKLKFRNEKQANAFLKRPYRQGWKVKGLG